MVNFVILDLVLLALIIIVSSFFLYKNKKNLGKEGALILYRTSWGIKHTTKRICRFYLPICPKNDYISEWSFECFSD